MALYLLDSDAVIDYLNDFTSSVELIQGLNGGGHILSVCDVVIAEVYSGLSQVQAEIGRLMLDACVYLACPASAAEQAGSWRYQFARRGITLAATDTLIAATAVNHNATLVTGNVRHYPMPELSLLPLPR